MLLKKILQLTSASPNVFFRDPFKPVETDQLILEIIGLANVDFDGARYIVFGINKATMEGSGAVGLDDDKLANLKSAHQLIATLVQPALQLAFIYDEIDGKLVGALEIDGCEEQPYQAACDYSETLTEGRSWIREGSQFRAMEAGELDAMRPDLGNAEEWNIALGIGSDPEAVHVDLQVPDSSDPPSERTAQREALSKLDWKQATVEVIGTINTSIANLMEAGSLVAPTMDDRDRDALESFQQDAERRVAAQDDHYFYEECALRLQLTLRNDDVVALQDLEISLGLPRIDGLRIAERVYPAPDGSTDPLDAAKYPVVQNLDKGHRVSVKLSDVPPKTTRTVFGSPIRLAVDPKLMGKKLAINCKLSAANKNVFKKTRLTISFVAAATEATAAACEKALATGTA